MTVRQFRLRFCLRIIVQVIGMVPQIGAWAGFCSNDTVSGQDGEADPPPLPFHDISAIIFSMKRLLPILMVFGIFLFSGEQG